MADVDNVEPLVAAEFAPALCAPGTDEESGVAWLKKDGEFDDVVCICGDGWPDELNNAGDMFEFDNEDEERLDTVVVVGSVDERVCTSSFSGCSR